jgi:hypothetical protein
MPPRAAAIPACRRAAARCRLGRERARSPEPSVWWWLATRTNLHRSNENVKNIGEERRTQGGRRRADEPSGLAGPRARATDREDAWQEPHSPPTCRPTTEDSSHKGEKRDARENAAKRATEPTNQPARQTTRPRRRQTDQPTGHQPAQPDPRPDVAAVRLRPSLQPSSRRHPCPAVQTGARLALARHSQHMWAGGRGQGHAPGGRYVWSCVGVLTSLPVPVPRALCPSV